MATQTAVVKPHRALFVNCSVCNQHEMRIDHVMGKLAGPWYCDYCGAKTTIDTRDYDSCGEVLVTSDPTPRRVWLICELIPQDEPIRIAYSMLDYDPDAHENDEERDGYRRFLIEEYQCPTNITRSIEAVFVGESDDAHGIFRYLQTVPRRKQGGPDVTGYNTVWVDHHAPGLLKARAKGGA